MDYLLGKGDHAGREISDFPTLTLLDFKLPKVSGMEVLRQIRADSRLRRMPVVVLTSSREDRDLAILYDLGVNSYILKPVDFQQFAQSIEQIGLYWLVLNEPPPKAKAVDKIPL